jgi:hypothetical protein
MLVRQLAPADEIPPAASGNQNKEQYFSHLGVHPDIGVVMPAAAGETGTSRYRHTLNAIHQKIRNVNSELNAGLHACKYNFYC